MKISTDRGEIELCLQELDIEIEYKVPEWVETDEPEACFTYVKHTYFLSEILRVPEGSPFYGKFDGYCSETFFSGIVTKLSECGDSISVWTYIY